MKKQMTILVAIVMNLLWVAAAYASPALGDTGLPH